MSCKQNLRNSVKIVAFGFLFTHLIVCVYACADKSSQEFYPSIPEPFMGNWEGRWSEEEEVDPVITAQVIALGKDKYQIRLAPKLFMRSPVFALIEATAKDGVIQFDQEGYKGEIRDGLFKGARRSGRVTFEMQKKEFKSPTLGMAPPPGALVLFDGSSLNAWLNTEGWILVEANAVMVTPDAKDLVSKEKFKDLQLHVEFRTPFQPQLRGQSRGNSGVFVQDVYEVQVLDSFGLDGNYDECGALYKVSAPYVNACLPPTEWQTYDIIFHAARFNEDGTVKTYPRMTVHHNGYVVQKDQEIPWITAWKEKDRLQPPPKDPGSIMLQSHRSHYVQYKNIWVVDLGYSE